MVTKSLLRKPDKFPFAGKVVIRLFLSDDYASRSIFVTLQEINNRVTIHMRGWDWKRGFCPLAHYYVTVDCEPYLAPALNALMVERGAEPITTTEWIMEADSHTAMEVYNGIAAVVGQCSVVVKELKTDPTWGDVVMSQDLFFDLLRSS